MSEEPPKTTDSDNAADNWLSALSEFTATRLELIKIESRDLGQMAARKTAHAVVLAVAGLVGWLCLLAGLIGILHHFTDFPWWSGALVLAFLHALLAWRFAALLKSPSPPAFPLTRAEFQKDQLWMQRLKKPDSKN